LRQRLDDVYVNEPQPEADSSDTSVSVNGLSITSFVPHVAYLVTYFHMIQSKPGKRKRGDIRTGVAMLIAPKYTEQAPGDIESMDWEDTDAEFGQTQKWEDEMDLQAVTLAISRGNPKRPIKKQRCERQAPPMARDLLQLPLQLHPARRRSRQ